MAVVRLLVPLLLLLLLAAARAGAANFRLSEGGSFSDVYRAEDDEPLVTPDGRWVFYRQDADVDEAVELWRVAAVGGPPERISGLLPANENVSGVELTPDGGRVLFRSPQEDADLHELFAVPVDAPPGSWVKVNGAVPPGMVVDYRSGISPDSSRLLYATNHPYDETVTGATAELWVAEVDGADQTPIVTLPAERRFGNHAATPDFSRAVYLADPAVAERVELWSVPIAGGTPIRLNGALVGGGDVLDYTIAADGTVFYRADQQIDERTELYRVPAAGGAAIKVSHTLTTGHSVGGFALTPGGARVLYAESDAVGEVVEIWSIAPDGSDRAGLLGARVAGGHVIALAFNDAYFVFVADKLIDETFELFSTPIGGGAIVKLNPTLVGGGDVVATTPANQPQILPDGSGVLYAADQGTNNVENLYRVPLTGGASTAVGGATTVGLAGIESFHVSPDGDRVARVRRSRFVVTNPWATHLSIASLAGGAWRQVDGCPAEVCEIDHDPAFSPTDPKTIFYVADQLVDERFDLYAGDVCLLCDGFEVGTTERWSLASP